MESFIDQMIDKRRQILNRMDTRPWLIKKDGEVKERHSTETEAMSRLVELEGSVYKAIKAGWKVEKENEGKVPDDKDPEATKIKKLTEEEIVRDELPDKEPEPRQEPTDEEPEPKREPPDEEEEPSIDKEYVGKTEDIHYYLISIEGETEEVPSDLQIVDQEGVKKYSAKDQNIDPSDVAEFIIKAIQEVEIDDITRSIFTKYILPKLEEEDEEEEEMMEEPEGEKLPKAEEPEKEPKLPPEPEPEEERPNESKKVNEHEPASKEEGEKYWRSELIRHLEKMGDSLTPEEKDLLVAAKKEEMGPVPEGKVPDDKDQEATKIKKLTETTVYDGDHTFEVNLVDDGTLDTVISINGHEYRFDQEFASMWRDEETGEMSEEGLKELALDALSTMEPEEYDEIVKGENMEGQTEEDEEEQTRVERPKPKTYRSEELDKDVTIPENESKINEALGKDVRTIFGPGDYYFGDICYVMKDEIYHGLWGETYGYKNGVYKHEGEKFAVAGTKWGDGVYMGSDGVEYGVDAGVLGIVPKSMWKEDAEGEELGSILKVEDKLVFAASDGLFKIRVDGKLITVDTRELSTDVEESKDNKDRPVMAEIKEMIMDDELQLVIDEMLDGSITLEEADKKLKGKGGRKLKAGAKKRHRGKVTFSWDSPKVKDKKDHFPINNIKQARNALSRVAQYDASPSWYKGSLSSLKNAVKRAVKSAYPSIEVSESKVNENRGPCLLKKLLGI